MEQDGPFVKGEDGEWETPLVNGSECAYVVFEGQQANCGIEAAYNAGAISWKKPVSCHLYPVRIKEYTELTAVNYHKWQICDAACSLGNELQVPIYKFVKEASSENLGKLGIQNWRPWPKTTLLNGYRQDYLGPVWGLPLGIEINDIHLECTHQILAEIR